MQPEPPLMTSANFLLIPQITDISVALYKMEQNFKTNEKNKFHPPPTPDPDHYIPRSLNCMPSLVSQEWFFIKNEQKQKVVMIKYKYKYTNTNTNMYTQIQIRTHKYKYKYRGGSEVKF